MEKKCMKRHVDIKNDYCLRISQHASDANETRKSVSLLTATYDAIEYLLTSL